MEHRGGAAAALERRESAVNDHITAAAAADAGERRAMTVLQKGDPGSTGMKATAVLGRI